MESLQARRQRETQAGLYLDGLRMKCFAVRTGERASGAGHAVPQSMPIFNLSFHKTVQSGLVSSGRLGNRKNCCCWV